MPGKLLKILFIAFAVVILFNLAALDFFWLRRTTPVEVEKAAEEESDSCKTTCLKEIAGKVQEEVAKNLPPAGPTLVPLAPAVCKIPTSTQSKVIYIPLTTSGTTKATTWADIIPSEFYFDLASYPGAKEVRFETYLSAVNGAARVFARLYDATNKRGVDASDLSTQNEAFTRLESGALSIWRGNNKYTVQIKSEIGIEAQLKEARLKILF